MERELKFRAWDGEKMVIPEFINNRNGIASWRENSIPETSHELMQFTGLLDDASEMIYEGDIVEDIIGNRLLVEWNDDTCKFQFSDGSDINDKDRYGAFKIIIGNIFSTPSLLNQK